jgi:hypothetical protein
MKKLVFILTAVLLTAMSVNVFAQNNGVTPTPGSTFTYNVTDNGNTYLWSVTKGDLTTVTTDATIGTAGAATTTIAWAPTATIGSIYYVHLLETDANSCSNQKVLKVTISASQFYLAIAADQTSPACYHGKATISYTITPTGLGSATGYSFDLADVLSQTTNFASVPTVTSGNASITTGVVTVTDTNPVTIEYVVTNSNLYDNTTDAAGTSANFKQTVNITNGVTSLGVRANTSTPANYTDETDVARPATTSIGFN